MSSTLQDISLAVNQKMVAYINDHYSANKGVLNLYTLQQELPLKLTTEENTLFQSLVAKPYGKLYEVTFEGVTVVESWVGVSSYHNDSNKYVHCIDNEQEQVVHRQIISNYHTKKDNGEYYDNCIRSDWEIIKEHAKGSHIYDATLNCLVRDSPSGRLAHSKGDVLILL